MPSTNGHGPKQAILYARVSTDEQARSGYSLAQQLEARESTQPVRATRSLRRSKTWPERGVPRTPRYGPYEGLGGGWWRLSGASSGSGPFQPRARLHLPAATRVRGAWLRTQVTKR